MNTSDIYNSISLNSTIKKDEISNYLSPNKQKN